MRKSQSGRADALWQQQDREWRDPAGVVGLWGGMSAVDPETLVGRAAGAWWDVLRSAGITLLVTREYEHLAIALSAGPGSPRVSYFPIPHPSGVAVDRARSSVTLASTRNPNQIVVFEPAGPPMARDDVEAPAVEEAPLLPVRTAFMPGALYLHDLAYVGRRLHGTAAGQNAVVALGADGRHDPVWWPRSIEGRGGPALGRNYLQLNSIAAGGTLERSFFTASADRPSARRPGHRHFPVDRRGVLLSGATREAIVGGLTRPHSARFHRRRVWVANSGYGELGVCDANRFEPVVRLPGWTRGLCFCGGIAFVGTSRVLPRFSQYAPGLDVARAVCGVHAVEARSGRVLGSYIWPAGNQIFACDWIARDATAGFPFTAGTRGAASGVRRLFYTFSTFSTFSTLSTGPSK